VWQRLVLAGFQFARAANRDLTRAPSADAVTRYFERRAPEELDLPALPPVDTQWPNRYQRRHLGLAGYPAGAMVSHVRFAALSPPHDRVLVVCDMRHSLVLVHDLRQPNRLLATIGKTANPASAQPIDLDGDGWVDLLVADLGHFMPTDNLTGRIVWLRRRADSANYDPIVLAESLGRVADVQAADFDGDGDLDLVAAVFGWRTTGDIRYLENRTTDWQHPQFVSRVLESKTGAIHVPTADLNCDGRPDFVALISQEHELVIAFLNQGRGQFRQRLIHAAGNPAFGSTGIQLVDFDGDGDLDVLYTNGDSLDDSVLKPFHGIRWLENDGGFPFRDHLVAAMPGVQRAVAGDVDGDGDLDVVAGAFTLAPQTPLDSLIWVENCGGGKFQRHSLEREPCRHASLDLADYDGDGDLDWVVGNIHWSGDPSQRLESGWLTIWEYHAPLSR
jgi:hypothetical protein